MLKDKDDPNDSINLNAKHVFLGTVVGVFSFKFTLTYQLTKPQKKAKSQCQ